MCSPKNSNAHQKRKDFAFVATTVNQSDIHASPR
jgi:hypothetical protein